MAQIIIDPAVYWELRTRTLEHQRLVESAQRQIQESQRRLDALMTQAGLDAAQSYRLNDEAYTAVSTEAQAQTLAGRETHGQ